MKSLVASAVCVMLITSATSAQNNRDLAVKDDKKKLANDDAWIYNDYDKAAAAAKAAKKPLLVVFR